MADYRCVRSSCTCISLRRTRKSSSASDGLILFTQFRCCCCRAQIHIEFGALGPAQQNRDSLGTNEFNWFLYILIGWNIKYDFCMCGSGPEQRNCYKLDAVEHELILLIVCP